jgi:cytosine/adenosine deaminase-related metal-dependent hydrolase
MLAASSVKRFALALALVLVPVLADRSVAGTVTPRCALAGVHGCHRSHATLAQADAPAPWTAGRGLLIDGATVVTMDDAHTVIPHGRVLVRDGRIVAVWSGPQPPAGVSVGHASVIEAGPNDLLFPGLINLHDHPSFDALDPWLPPASDALPSLGKAGTDPYANRYQWGASGSPSASPEERRLIVNPANVLNDADGLGLSREVNRYAQTAALLGGETTLVGGDGDIVRGAGSDPRVAPQYTGPIAALDGTGLASLRDGIASGRYEAWLVHLAEGVRDADRRAGDPFSSRAEFDTLKTKGLLTASTVIVHGTGLERSDFAEMHTAGAKLVWSPLSNLLLYGRTTNVYDALAEGVLVSLGTDWAPSGSRDLLDELKVADVALRDPRILGASRDEVPAFALDGRHGQERRLAEETLDRELADMVTRNPALSLGWYDRLGSIEPGKLADLLLIHRPTQTPPDGVPESVYRDLIDAGERDIELVLVGGRPTAGDVDLMAALKPSDYEIVTCRSGGYDKAVDIISTAAEPASGETLAQTSTELQAGLNALGGDDPPAAGGPGPTDNTYTYLKTHIAGGAAASLPDPVFRSLLASEVGVLPDGSLNLEPIQLDPLFEQDDQLLTDLLQAIVDPVSGLIADPNPPYKLYPADLNFVGPLGDPLAAAVNR